VAVLETELERREAIFAQAGQADDTALSIYQTSANCLRRLLESLGLERKQKDVTPIETLIEEYDARGKTEATTVEPGP
jgi:hypothetical protein